MPAIRSIQTTRPSKYFTKDTDPESHSVVPIVKENAQRDKYPVGSSRLAFRTKDGKAVTRHAWTVYDFVRQVPHGRVTTYKDICVSLAEGSPRSVGWALAQNPFAPYVPCHRVIASTLFIGGFCGEWGTHGKGGQCDKKMTLLAEEGVEFSAKGYLINRELLWRG